MTRVQVSRLLTDWDTTILHVSTANAAISTHFSGDPFRSKLTPIEEYQTHFACGLLLLHLSFDGSPFVGAHLLEALIPILELLNTSPVLGAYVRLKVSDGQQTSTHT